MGGQGSGLVRSVAEGIGAGPEEGEAGPKRVEGGSRSLSLLCVSEPTLG